MKITVVGTGYVGLSLATLLSIKNEVVAIDISEIKVDLINKRKSPIIDELIEDYFENRVLNLCATLDKREAYIDTEIVIIATPTNYDEDSNYFDTSSIESVIDDVMEVNPKVPLIIKSTIPVGYTEKIRIKYKKNNIAFSPEFLREGKALYDNLYPSRIIVGDEANYALTFAKLLKEASLKEKVDILMMTNTEAEAVKLFSNTYLALRVAYFNELDTYAEIKNLDTKNIIKGVGLDPRIGEHYNNPSFGYGGYCLPKDTKQLLANYDDVPQNLIAAIVDANNTRKNHIVNRILVQRPNVVGIYRLIMKKDSDNFRQSAIQDIISRLQDNNIEVQIFEPTIFESKFEGLRICKNLDEFKTTSDIIVANRMDDVLSDVLNKVYSRDIFREN